MKNKPLVIIVFFLIVSILIAVYFQFSLVEKIYLDKRAKLENRCTNLLEEVIVSVEKKNNLESFDVQDYYNNLMVFIIKDTNASYKMNEIEFNDYFKSTPFGSTSYKIEIQSKKLNVIREAFSALLKNEKLSIQHEINFYKEITYKQYEKLHNESDIIIAYAFGIFGIHLENEKTYLLTEMKDILISSLFFISTMIFCGTLLIKKYLNEKKLSIYKNEFINNLTHELQTPLTISRLALEKLSIDLKDNFELSKYLAIIYKENNKIEKLAKRILNLAELKSVVAKKEKINVSKSIQNVVNRYKSVILDKDILLTDLNHLELQLNGNKELFLDLLDNLLSNAIKYSKSPRSIIIKTTIKHGKIYLSIKDNGIGIPSKFNDKIFTPFFKVPKNNTHEIKSNGLGLSYVAEIVKQMKGSISFSSEIDKGTTFNIILPYEN